MKLDVRDNSILLRSYCGQPIGEIGSRNAVSVSQPLIDIMMIGHGAAWLKGLMVAVFFIADMHFGSPYRSYAKPRDFASVEAMHEAIAHAWRTRVTANDTVWVLGDVGNVEVLRELPGTRHLVFGNDDRPKRGYKDCGVFASLMDSHVLATKQGSILLVHRPKDAKIDNLPVLHGHTHAAPDEPNPRFVSVSVDKTGWGPISLDEVMRRFETRARSRAG